jgi:hypothetical protein
MRWLASWILYWMGDAVCRAMDLIPNDWPDYTRKDWHKRGWGRVVWLLCQAYQSLMGWSIIVQGDGRGAWDRADD